MPSGEQRYDRYAYVSNNPLRYMDPSGHMMTAFTEGGSYNLKPASTFQPNYKPSGNQIQINIMRGMTFSSQGLDGNPQTVGFLYYSLSAVTDDRGNVQFYMTALDQEYLEASESPTHTGGYKTVDPLGEEIDNKDSAYGLGLSLGWGMIDGEKFRNEGTTAYAGKAMDIFGGAGDVSDDAYAGLDDNGNITTDLVGVDIAASIGVPVSMGSVTVNSVPINRKPLQIPKMFIPMCQGLGMCGSSTVTGSQPFP